MLRKTPPLDVGHKRLNLIPILDAIFIFIFFLLFSTQFIKIYIIDSDVPIISEIPNDEVIKDEPLNLTVKISKAKVILTTGVDNNIYKTFNRTSSKYLDQLKLSVLDLKKKNPDEKFIIISPQSNVKYDHVIKIIDAVKKLPKKLKSLKIETKKKNYEFAKIFEQIVLVPAE